MSCEGSTTKVSPGLRPALRSLRLIAAALFILLHDHVILDLLKINSVLLGSVQTYFPFSFENKMIYVVLYMYWVLSCGI